MITEAQADKIIELLVKIEKNTNDIESNTSRTTFKDIDDIDSKLDKVIESIKNIRL